MAIPLRVVQQFYDEEDGTRVWTNYRLEVMTAEDIYSHLVAAKCPCLQRLLREGK